MIFTILIHVQYMVSTVRLDNCLYGLLMDTMVKTQKDVIIGFFFFKFKVIR